MIKFMLRKHLKEKDKYILGYDCSGKQGPFEGTINQCLQHLKEVIKELGDRI